MNNPTNQSEKRVYNCDEYLFSVEYPKDWIEIHTENIPPPLLSELSSYSHEFSFLVAFCDPRYRNTINKIDTGDLALEIASSVHETMQTVLVAFYDPQYPKNNIAISVLKLSRKESLGDIKSRLMQNHLMLGGKILSKNITRLDDIYAVEVTSLIKQYNVIHKQIIFDKWNYQFIVSCTALIDKFKMCEPIFDEFLRSIQFKSRPDDADTHNILGVYYEEKGLYKEAEQEYLHALEIDQKCYEAYCNMGSICGKTNRWEESERYYKCALEVNPGDPSTLFNLGQVSLAENDADKSLEYFCKTIVADILYEPRVHQLIHRSICHPNEYIRKLTTSVNEKLREIYRANGSLKRNKEIEEMYTGDSDTLAYSNDKYGLSIKCPEGWRIDHTYFNPEMLVQFVDSRGGGINLVAGPIYGPQESVQDLENLALQNVRRLGGNLEALKRIKVGNIEAVEVIYTALGLKTKKVGLVRDKIEYIVTCSIYPILFNEYDQIFDECIQSLKFNREQTVEENSTENSWLDRIVAKAKLDSDFAMKIREIYKLDLILVPKGGFIISQHYQRMKSPEFQEMMHRSSILCDEIAEKIAEANDDSTEIAQWISYNIGTIARKLSIR